MERALIGPGLRRQLLQAWLSAGRVAAHQWLLLALCVLALLAGGMALHWQQQVRRATTQQQVLRQQIRQLEQTARRRLQASTATAVTAGAAAAANGSATPGHLAQFNNVLSQRELLGPSIETLFALAQANGLELQRADYQYSRDSASGVYLCQVSLPLKGDYANIWAFVLDVLQSLPFAALQDISFRRDSIADPAPQALLRVTLYSTRLGTP